MTQEQRNKLESLAREIELMAYVDCLKIDDDYRIKNILKNMRNQIKELLNEKSYR